MFGLILSKSASQYQDMALAAGLTKQQFSIGFKASDISSHDKSLAQWLLAEPSLALEILNDLPQLRWLQSTWAGVESLLEPSHRSDYQLTNIRRVFAPLMTEYVLAHCLAHERRILAHHDAKRNKHWLNETNGIIRGKTMLLLGVGSIGLGIAQSARYLGLRVIGVVHTPRTIAELDEVGSLDDLAHLLPQADYVVNVLPNTPSTQNFINTSFLAAMKPSAVLINVGRGQAVVEEDLVHALHHEVIAHAVLDVYRIEPLPEQHPFWSTPRLTLTSHTAAPSFPIDIFKIFINNFQRFIDNKPLENIIDFKKGY